jgi:hypothetical protein
LLISNFLAAIKTERIDKNAGKMTIIYLPQKRISLGSRESQANEINKHLEPESPRNIPSYIKELT